MWHEAIDETPEHERDARIEQFRAIQQSRAILRDAQNTSPSPLFAPLPSVESLPPSSRESVLGRMIPMRSATITPNQTTVTPEKPRRFKRLRSAVFAGALAIGAVAGGLFGLAQQNNSESLPIPIEQADQTADAEANVMQDWYKDFVVTQPDVTYGEFTAAVESQEFADMSAWAEQHPDQDFGEAMRGFYE